MENCLCLYVLHSVFLSLRNLCRPFESFDSCVYIFTNGGFILWEQTLLICDRSECVILGKPGQTDLLLLQQKGPTISVL